jgi:hypothetical protein
MRPRPANGDAAFTAEFTEVEVEILQQLIGELTDVIDTSNTADPHSSQQAILDRLFPAAYHDDADAEAEFRRFTSTGLADRKVGNAQAVCDSLTAAERRGTHVVLELSAAQCQPWLRTLTDLRLTLAVALGIDSEDEVPPATAEEEWLADVYNWLGFVQECVVAAVDV